MQKTWFFCPAVSALLLSACAGLPPGWAEYRDAMKCHFQNKNEECDKSYEEAIKKNPKLPGLQASYASHLYQRGDAVDAREHFREEIANHPRAEKAIAVALKAKSDSVAVLSATPKR